MAKTLLVKPLGLVLQTAGLVNSQQVQTALKEREFFPRLKIGEIMAKRGWISQQTADFFAEQWPQLLGSLPKQPIGQYFKAAGLLDESQIQMILREQADNNLKFGMLAVIKGMISQTTLDFFLEQLELAPTIEKAEEQTPAESFEAKKNQVENCLIYNSRCEPTVLLNLYRQIRQHREIAATGSQAEEELLQSGLVVKDNHKIKLDPNGDRDRFDESWIQQQLVRLQPYNKIRIKLFGLETKASDPYRVVAEVNSWTGGQSFLSQKVYQLLSDRNCFILKNQEATKISELVYKHIIDDWEHQSAASHLLKLCSLLLNSPMSPHSCLLSYQKIWHGRAVVFERTPQQQYLLEIGLVKLKQNKIRVANRIYREVFDRHWLKKQLLASHSNSSSQENNSQLSTKQGSSSVNQHNSSRLIKTVTMLVCLGGLAWFSWNSIAKYQQLQRFRQANLLLAQKKYTSAIQAYDRLLSTNFDKRHSIWINRGYAFLGLNQYQDMLQSCSTATLIEPQAAMGWNCKGEALYYLERYPKAFQAFERATKVNPQEATFWLNKAKVLSQLQKYQEAIVASQQAIQLSKQSRTSNSVKQRNLAIAYHQKGQDLLYLNRDRQSLLAFEESLNHSPNFLSAQQGKGIALYETGQYQEAIAIFAMILQRDDLTPEQQAASLLYQGVSYCQLQKTTAAEQAFDRVLQLTTDSQSQRIAQKGCGIR
ncbi:MAG: tetratricopeptide repeat protein [Pleurocapsa sp. MO_226.B13]|nr:tetratricopeptide repeat protein [Pleurocapsa sp. MO_226.B13]